MDVRYVIIVLLYRNTCECVKFYQNQLRRDGHASQFRHSPNLVYQILGESSKIIVISK